MPNELQAKGLQHIRNLRELACKIHRNNGGHPDLFLDCIEAALLNHRLKCVKQLKKEIEESIESGNPS
jgi:hypothetical protein